jgi:hypothetical protein
MHPKFKSWLTKQIYAPYKRYSRSPTTWMIHSVKEELSVKYNKKLFVTHLTYNWKDILHEQRIYRF